MRRSVLLSLALLVSVAQAFLVGPTAGAATLDGAETDLLAQINGFRASRGLSTLAVSDTLTAAAKWMATDLSVNNYFSHTSLDGRNPTQRMADAGYPAFATWSGEDLAAGYTSAAQVLNGWINSPAHLAVLTNPAYRAIGIGRAFASASSYGWYWDADFGGVVDRGAAATSFDAGFHGGYVGQSPNVTLAPGQATTLVVALRNTGYRGWYRGSPGQQANLGVSGDAARPELASDWLFANRVATTTTSYVGPGQTGWFQFAVHAPASPGVYRLDLRGVIDGTTWLEDSGIYFLITVN